MTIIWHKIRHFHATKSIWRQNKITNVSKRFVYHMFELGSWRFGSIKIDQHLLLEPSIDKQRELSCAPNIFLKCKGDETPQGHVILEKSSKFMWIIWFNFYIFVSEILYIKCCFRKLRNRREDKNGLRLTTFDFDNETNVVIYFAKIELFCNFKTKSSLSTSIFIFSNVSEIL